MPNLISPDGTPFRTEIPAEVTRLRARGYTVEGEPVTTIHDELFHPTGRTVDEVQSYIEEHPEDATRVIAEEKAGKARVSIVGS